LRLCARPAGRRRFLSYPAGAPRHPVTCPPNARSAQTHSPLHSLLFAPLSSRGQTTVWPWRSRLSPIHHSLFTIHSSPFTHHSSVITRHSPFPPSCPLPSLLLTRSSRPSDWGQTLSITSVMAGVPILGRRQCDSTRTLSVTRCSAW